MTLLIVLASDPLLVMLTAVVAAIIVGGRG